MSNSRNNNNSRNSLPPTLQRLKQGAIETRPEQIEDLWRRQLPANHPLTQFEHIHAQHMDWWVTEQEVSELLNDEDRLLAIRQDLNVRALQIGMVGQAEYATTIAFFTIPLVQDVTILTTIPVPVHTLAHRGRCWPI